MGLSFKEKAFIDFPELKDDLKEFVFEDDF
jgi:hypothetical protein